MRWRSADWAAWYAAKPRNAPANKTVGRAVWSKAARRLSPPGATLDGLDPDAARKGKRGDLLDPRALRKMRYRSRLSRNPVRPRLTLEPTLLMELSPTRAGAPPGDELRIFILRRAGELVVIRDFRELGNSTRGRGNSWVVRNRR